MGSCLEWITSLTSENFSSGEEEYKQIDRLNSITCQVCLFLCYHQNSQKMMICPEHQVCKICIENTKQCQTKPFCNLCEYLEIRRLKKTKEKSVIQSKSHVTISQIMSDAPPIKRDDIKNSNLKQLKNPFMFNPKAITLENERIYTKIEEGDWEYVVLKRNLKYGEKQKLKLITNENANFLIGVTNRSDPKFDRDELFGLCSYRQCSIFSNKEFYLLNKSIRSSSILTLEVDLENNKEIMISQSKQDSTDSSIKNSEKDCEIICNLMIPDLMLENELYIFIALDKRGDYFEILLD